MRNIQWQHLEIIFTRIDRVEGIRTGDRIKRFKEYLKTEKCIILEVFFFYIIIPFSVLRSSLTSLMVDLLMCIRLM